MKQLTCEMCGSTDLTKQDGVFVCQTCGTKYSVEEAKKMMVEVQGTVNVQNAAQLENLLKMAHSSFDSKNYARAEEFCNQVIAMDAKNYDAWKLKGEAINYQITAKNPRILEVYNCIMTSYRVLTDELKSEKREEVLKSIRICLEGEIDFWINQFKAQRPTSATLNKVKTTFLECTVKVAESFMELGYSKKDAADYVRHMQGYFVKKANSACTDVWKTTVYYNYHRDGFTDAYHPTTEILKSFIDETDTLIELWEFCIKQFTDDVPVTLRATVFNNIVYCNEQLCSAQSYKRMVSTTTNGYGAVVSRREYWDNDKSLTDNEKESRRKKNEEYKEKVEQAFEADGEKRSVSELLTLAKQHLDDKDAAYALYRYNAIIKKDETNSIAYLGKALATWASKRIPNDMIDNILLSSKYKNETQDQKYIQYLLNYRYDEFTLLIESCYQISYDASAYLIELGADVNAKTKANTTPLWYIARQPLPGYKVNDGRRLARLLIDKGAELNITGADGIALYNKSTDPEIAQMIQAKNPSLEKGKSGGCYVATAVYGSYNCPQVWTLRRYRDYTLAETWYGRAFIHTYYAISPTLVKWFGHTEWFKKMWKGKLDRMVANLNAEGVEDTPYEDRNW